MRLSRLRTRKRNTRALTKSEQMARVRSADTEPEVVLRRALWRTGLRYRVRPKLPGTPDLCFPSAKMAVFVDGCFWHGCPDHYVAPVANAPFWSRKISRNMQRDHEVGLALSAMGWKVMRIWEHQIFSHLETVVSEISAEVSDRVPVKNRS